ncbi:TetR/AcrR family transcriptional regulator [Nocardia sp. CDC159]|uniref:TetR/AcrR family transcriptional regulator n=1 Tax=Nocardia pulmonis TaxID=2951408 RepID=A0A9X2EBC3_9NOCA|nr:MULTISPECIES: TetR/AcrR family transcriptional regulator [Nocardia]MCM6775246.1 TetR/AcrR family transcriptional regulator [Nocardia pulmonis]MCM6788020.1 TetR/AcrR family transcriptional regulator [Nocardia sp. CDC159]
MPRPLDQARRAELLSGVIAYIGERGLTELSLRPLADYLGTSSRMLIHYFGTKEQMLVAALETQRPDIAGLFADVPDIDTLRRRLIESFVVNTTSDWATSTRVLFQVLGIASVPGSPYAAYAEEAVHGLVEALTRVLTELDPAFPDPQTTATLLISGIRGLLQDRLVTGDNTRVSKAARRLINLALPPAR